MTLRVLRRLSGLVGVVFSLVWVGAVVELAGLSLYLQRTNEAAFTAFRAAVFTDDVGPMDQPQRPARDQMFDVLSNQRRRSVIHYLKQRDDRAELRELSAQLAAWETGKSLDQLTGTDRKRVYTSLQQFHLPKMHRTDIVEFDTQQKVVELTPTADHLDVYLDVVTTNDIPWSKYYASLSVLSVFLVVGVLFEIYPLTVLPDVSWAVFMATTFSVSSLVHLYETRQTKLGLEGPPPDLRDDRF
jgi:hypothetical protein